MKKYQCPCCGYFTYNVPANEDCGYICPVCFWENDPFIASDNEPSDSNHGITLKKRNPISQNLVLVKKKCYVMSDHREMMKRKFHSNNVEVMEGIKVKDTAKRAIVTVIVFVIIYVLSGPIIGYTNYDMYLKGIEFLSAVIGAGCYWIGSNKK